jgi:hypothetical protein
MAENPWPDRPLFVTYFPWPMHNSGYWGGLSEWTLLRSLIRFVCLLGILRSRRPCARRSDHTDRSGKPDAVADLLWFTTGGGKTEAYLRLTAFTLAIRRLRGTVEGRSRKEGVAVLMRYTLRHLTLQQSQRATTLICACEFLRRQAESRGDQRWGKTPFRIGLWVGAATTPNRTAHSEEALKTVAGSADKKRLGAIGGGGSPTR